MAIALVYDRRPANSFPLANIPALKEAAMQARLKVLHDKSNVKQVKLLPVTLIGRSTECNLKIASSQVSRNHCRITLGADAVFVEDLGSANGTLVDGQPLPAHQPTAISPGAHLVVGPAEFQIDYVAATSATMVLSRSGVPPIPELPSTEMIFPPNPTPAAAVQTLVPQALPSASLEAAVSAQVNNETGPAVQTAPDPINGEPAMAVAPAAVAVRPVESQAAAAPRNCDTQFLDGGVDFGINANTDEADEATQFMFQETIPDSISLEDTATTPPAEQAPRKGGLKSLFSMFGRKDKQGTGGATHQASAIVAPAAVPSIFLPTMEAQAPIPTNVAPVESLRFGTVEPVPAGATETAALGGGSTTSNEADNDFQQFLSHL